MTRHTTLAAIVAALALALAAAAGTAAGPALLGAAIAAATSFATLLGFRLFGAAATKMVQRALAVFVAMFLVRMVLLAAGVFMVLRAGWSVTAFVIAFFVPYFVFAAIEGGYVRALGRRAGRTA